MMKKKVLLAAMLLLASMVAGAVAPLWMRDAMISPDGFAIKPRIPTN